MRKPCRIRLGLEALEDRLAPAVLSDSGTALLSIALAANENLAIVSNGTSYIFTSNQSISAASGADPADQNTAFSGLGTNTLTLTSIGINLHTTGISISDVGPGASVTFNDSGTEVYSNNVTVALGNAAAGAVSFNGASNFRSSNLQVSTTLDIMLNSGASLSSGSGNITLQANQHNDRSPEGFDLGDNGAPHRIDR